MRYPGFDSRYEPSLWVEQIHTGDSIRLKFKEGWIPRASTEDGEFLLELPKPLGLTVLMASLLLSGAEKVLNIPEKTNAPDSIPSHGANVDQRSPKCCSVGRIDRSITVVNGN